MVASCAVARRSGGSRSRANGALLGILACLTVLLVVGCSGVAQPSQQGAKDSTRSDTTWEEAESPTNQPNIIFVLTDDLDFASAQRMPTLRSQLIEKGTSFENAFVSFPLCCPSRATILTGLYVHNHGVEVNMLPNGGFEKVRDERHEENTIAARLQQAGYRTALFGKYLNEYPGDEDPSYVPPGWDEWYGKLDEQKLYNYRINENGEVVSYGNSTENFFTDVLSGQATDLVRRAEDSKPFFMYVAPTAPHEPATPAERHKGAFAGEKAPRPPSFNEEDVSDKPSYVRDLDRLSDEQASTIDDSYCSRLESMLAVDEMVDSLIKELKAAGKLDNTFIFFTSDNGWQQGEHRLGFGKRTPYEESAHVPLFVRGPGVRAGSKVEKLVVNTDFAPTFANLAGVRFPADGRSLVAWLRGEEPSWRSSILLEGFVREGGSDVGGGRGKGKSNVKPADPPAYKAVRTGTHKYVEYDNGDRELYDLKADPYELDNIYESADPSLLRDLKTRLDALRSCSGARCREVENAP